MTDRDPNSAAAPPADGVAFGEALRVWARVAALSFGGPAGQIAVMHRIVVEEKGWVPEARFLHALNFCMLLPGPEAHQLTIYLGWLLNGVRGAVVAGLLFVLPGFFAILALSYVYVAFGQTPAVEGLFFGLRAAVLAIVLQALARIGARTLTGPGRIAIAGAAFVAIFFLNLPFPMIIVAAALLGWLGARGGAAGAEPTQAARPGRGVSLAAPAVAAFLWLAPVAALALILGPDDVFSRLALFFSQLAIVTFGGAYAVLAYVAQAAVETHGWLSPDEMLDGLGMAETTPGPLIMVVQFVGFLAAFRDPGALSPWLAGALGAILTTWVTFTPSFLWILLGAPYLERLRGMAALSGALAAITAAVVGVILSLAIWFGSHVIFAEHAPVTAYGFDFARPRLDSLDPAALALTVAAIFATFRLRLGLFAVIGAAGAAGIGLRLTGIA